MPNYAHMKQGDFLPVVGVLQKLLNRDGAGLSADGDFGSQTRTAVVNFQSPRRLGDDGIVGQQTWPRIAAGADLPIIDCIDVFDPALRSLEMRDIIRVGGNPLLLGGTSNGVEQAVQQILSAAGRNVFLLRFHGHGSPGAVGFSDGRGDLGFDQRILGRALSQALGGNPTAAGQISARQRAHIDASNVAVMVPILQRLRPVFGPYGCVQFMHCKTGRGPNGRAVLTAIATALNVPVSAGVPDQIGGGVATFRFEGRTFTAVPGNQTLSSWCAGLPNFPAMTIP